MSNDPASMPLINQTCPTIAYQAATVCVPVTITPFAKTGNTFTKCCGNAVVVPGIQPCDGVKNGTCSFTISQNICVAVPVEFGAVASEGDTFVNCRGASSDNICADCSIPTPPASNIAIVDEDK